MNIKSALIIDDNEADRYLLKRTLRRAKICTNVFEATDGQKGLDFFADSEAKAKERPDEFPPLVVFLDVNMPKLDGFEFLESFSKLRKDSKLEHVKLIMFTSSNRDDDRERALKYDFVRGLMEKKIVDQEVFRAEVERALAE